MLFVIQFEWNAECSSTFIWNGMSKALVHRWREQGGGGCGRGSRGGLRCGSRCRRDWRRGVLRGHELGTLNVPGSVMVEPFFFVITRDPGDKFTIPAMVVESRFELGASDPVVVFHGNIRLWAHGF